MEQHSANLSETATIPFSFSEARTVRTLVKDDNEIWFVAKDVCDVLEIENYRDTVAKGLDEDEACVEKIYTSSRNQHGEFECERDMILINESGLYSLIFSSSKPQARAFRKWVTSEVLPALRRTGGYTVLEFVEMPESLPDVLSFYAHLKQQEAHLGGQMNTVRRKLRQCHSVLLKVAAPFNPALFNKQTEMFPQA